MEVIDEKLSSLWRRAQAVGVRIVRTFDLDRKFRAAQHYAQTHPMLTLIVLVAVCGLSVPVGAFVVFAAGSIAFTFMGFMFIEGTLLTIAGLVLGGILLVVSFFVVTFGGVVFLFYVFVNKLWTAVDSAMVTVSRKRDGQSNNPASTSVSRREQSTRPKQLVRNSVFVDPCRPKLQSLQSTVDSQYSDDDMNTSDSTLCASSILDSGDYTAQSNGAIPRANEQTDMIDSTVASSKCGDVRKNTPESESPDSSCSFDIIEKNDY